MQADLTNPGWRKRSQSALKCLGRQAQHPPPRLEINARKELLAMCSNSPRVRSGCLGMPTQAAPCWLGRHSLPSQGGVGLVSKFNPFQRQGRPPRVGSVFKFNLIWARGPTLLDAFPPKDRPRPKVGSLREQAHTIGGAHLLQQAEIGGGQPHSPLPVKQKDTGKTAPWGRGAI